MAGPFVLEIERGANVGTRFTLGATATIGRQEGLEITLHDTRVSRQHARLEVVETRVLLTDLGGANGTFVNRQRVDGSASLLPGDVIEVGATLLRLLGATAPQAKTVVAAQPFSPAAPLSPGVPPDPGALPSPGAAHAAPGIAPSPASPASTRTPLLIGGAVIVVVLLCLCIATVLALAAR